MRAFKRANKRTQYARVFGTGVTVDDWMESARNYSKNSGSDGSGSLSRRSEPEDPRKRMSVLKVFDGPMWTDEDG